MSEDIRWKQRFDNYTQALELLQRTLAESTPLSVEIQQLAITQAFEIVYELGYKVMKDYLHYQGTPQNELTHPKQIIRFAINSNLIDDGQAWMDAVDARNKTSHTYNQAVAQKLMADIKNLFFPAFVALKNKLQLDNE